MDSLRTFRRAHVYGIALNEKVDALDQLDPHLLGQECVFVIGGVVGARGENGDRRRLPTGRRQRMEVLEQQVRVMLDRPDRLGREELGRNLQLLIVGRRLPAEGVFQLAADGIGPFGDRHALSS